MYEFTYNLDVYLTALVDNKTIKKEIRGLFQKGLYVGGMPQYLQRKIDLVFGGENKLQQYQNVMYKLFLTCDLINVDDDEIFESLKMFFLED